MSMTLRRRIGCWLWAIPVVLAGLLIPPLWPGVLLRAALAGLGRLLHACAIPMQRMARATARALGSTSVKRFVFVVAVIAIGAAWLYSHVSPERFGSCHEVALNIGHRPSIRECHPYGTSDFAVPLALVVIIAFGLGGDSDIAFTIPGLGTFERTRRAKRAARVLEQEGEDLERRGREFVESVEVAGTDDGDDGRSDD